MKTSEMATSWGRIIVLTWDPKMFVIASSTGYSLSSPRKPLTALTYTLLRFFQLGFSTVPDKLCLCPITDLIISLFLHKNRYQNKRKRGFNYHKYCACSNKVSLPADQVSAI